MKSRVIFLGPPGSGKGTIATQLYASKKWHYVSSGHWLRCEVDSNATGAKEIAAYMDRGELVPDAFVLKVMKSWFASHPARDGFILDGFPRTIAQAQQLDEWLNESGSPVSCALFFDCKKSVILSRIAGRRSCPRCSRVYHVVNIPPKCVGKCDDCGETLVQRRDDTIEVLERRFDIYQSQTEPLVGYYQKQGKLIQIDADMEQKAKMAAVLSSVE
jgi:adenylate kinase